jgi:hypothetical protein
MAQTAGALIASILILGFSAPALAGGSKGREQSAAGLGGAYEGATVTRFGYENAANDALGAVSALPPTWSVLSGLG